MHNIKPLDLLGLYIRAGNDAEVEVVIPSAQNLNDKGTLFAGSLFSGAVFSGYQLVRNIMFAKGINGTLVCKESTIKFLKPITGTAIARSKADSLFDETSSGNLRIVVKVEITNEKNQVCGETLATYVVVKG